MPIHNCRLATTTDFQDPQLSAQNRSSHTGQQVISIIWNLSRAIMSSPSLPQNTQNPLKCIPVIKQSAYNMQHAVYSIHLAQICNFVWINIMKPLGKTHTLSFYLQVWMDVRPHECAPDWQTGDLLVKIRLELKKKWKMEKEIPQGNLVYVCYFSN